MHNLTTKNSIKSEKVRVYAPASMANISAGFDILGAAISPVNGTLLGDCVSIESADTFELINEGDFAKKLPSNPRYNIVYQSWECFCKALGKSIPVKMTLEKNMPIGSGLGSSACSVVAALVALNEFWGQPFNKHQLLAMMGEMEGNISGSIHYDNVAPCYLGGMQLILDEQETISQPIPHFENWYWIMAYPGIKVSTAEARAILPQQYNKQDCVDHGRHAAGFVHACYSQQPNLAIAFMKDVIAEPYRKQLLPSFDGAQIAVKELGALTSGISGSGPTMFAVADNLATAEKVKQWLSENYVQNQNGFVHICKIDTKGARVI